MRFDNVSPWRGRATARRIGSGDMVFLYLSFDRSRFLVELAQRLNLRIFYNGDVVTQLPLRGTNAAVQEMIRCQRVADIARKNERPQGDPFAGGSLQKKRRSAVVGGGGGPSYGPSGPSSGPGPPAPARRLDPRSWSTAVRRPARSGPSSPGGGPTFRPSSGQ